MTPTGARPLVSIVVPCFDYGRFLPEALESACAQSDADVEVLVVDDGSADDTPEIAAAFGERVRYLRRPHGGLARARNAGAAVCRGELVIFLDADDRLDPDYVARCRAALEPGLAFVYTQVRYFGDREGVSRRPEFDLELLKRGNYIHASALIRTELVRRHPYDPRLGPGWEDWDFYLTLAERGHRGRLLDEPLLHYRRHAASLTGRLDRDPAAKSRLRAAVHRRHPRLFGWRRVIGAQLEAVRTTAAAALGRTRGAEGTGAAAAGSARSER